MDDLGSTAPAGPHLFETLTSRLPRDRPFTTATARSCGVDRAALERMLRTGSVRRLLRGVYAATTAPETREMRAAAVALAARRDVVAVDRTAAWVHGVGSDDGGPVPLDTVCPSHDRGTRGPGGSRRFAGRDLEVIGTLCLTTPLRTALDLGRLLPPDRALAAMDALLAGGGFSHVALLAELPRMVGSSGVGQLRSLAAQVDARSAGPAESVLRLRWHAADLPTAVPGQLVVAGRRLLRLSLGVERCRFGAVLAGGPGAEELRAVREAGWRVVVLPEQQVLYGDHEVWVRHLQREFHQQLLADLA